VSLGAVVVGTGFGIPGHARALRAADFDVLAAVGRDPEKTAIRALQMRPACSCPRTKR
jgi:predicted dehydrogenase